MINFDQGLGYLLTQADHDDNYTLTIGLLIGVVAPDAKLPV